MHHAFQIIGLDPQSPGLQPDARKSSEYCWLTVDQQPGFPCRVSLQDAAVGEQVLAISYLHHPASSPYQATGPVFIRAGVTQAKPAINEIPAFLKHRLLSVRAYDEQQMMVDARVIEGIELEAAIADCFARPQVSYLHIHNAGPGCYMCAINRVK